MEEFIVHDTNSNVSNEFRDKTFKMQGLFWECRKCHVYLLTKKIAICHATFKCAKEKTIRMPPADRLICYYCNKSYKSKKWLIKHIHSASNHYLNRK